MQLSKTTKLLLLLASLLPIGYVFCFIVCVWVVMGMGMMLGHLPDQQIPVFFPVLFVLQLSVILLSFALQAFYLYYLFTTTRVPQDQKALWAVVLLLAGFLTMPVFWYFFIWLEPQSSNEQPTKAA
jgi:hypothetical protein